MAEQALEDLCHELELLMVDCPAGRWALATSCSWRRVIIEHSNRPVITPTVDPRDGHVDLDAGTNHAHLRLAIAAVNALPRLLPAARGYVPGVMHCEKCNFRLVRKNLYVLDGTIGAGGSEPEPCPNGCGTQLAPVTWEQDAREAWKRLEEMVEQAQAASPDAIGPKLPSRFQIGETIRARGEKGVVQAVSFLVIDGQGKVAYDVLTRRGLQARVLSDDVGPAQPSHLRSVDRDG